MKILLTLAFTATIVAFAYFTDDGVATCYEGMLSFDSCFGALNR
jgi:hypothetical protein